MYDVRDAVDAGVMLLDINYPGWHREIDVEALDMQTHECCVLGQLYKRFTAGKEELGITNGRDYGFAYHIGDVSENAYLAWKRLRQLWVDEIDMRLINDLAREVEALEIC